MIIQSTICDGCQANLNEPRPGTPKVALRGTRADGLVGGGLPDGEFHLCRPCSVIALHAAATATNRESRTIDRLVKEMNMAKLNRDAP